MAHVFAKLIIISLSILFITCSNNIATRPDIPVDKIKTGDIAFRRGEGIVSDIVIYNDAGGKYSHIGVIINHNDSLMVIHAVPGEHETPNDFDRVRINHINDFFAPKRAIKGAIMSIDITDMQREHIKELALKKVRSKTKFDHNYNLNDTTKLYCTELVQLLFKHINIDLAENRFTTINCPGMSNKYIMPSDIYKNEKLKTIFYY